LVARIIRAPWWNYAWDAAYFITICTANRRWYFGRIKESRMHLSKPGVVAKRCWDEITNHAGNVTLGEFVVMPNHVHGILILKGNRAFARDSPVRTADWQLHPRYRNPGKNNVSSIIGSYKSAVSKHAHLMRYEFGWQSRFHDHIIRNEEEHQRIATYIINNPRKWPADRFNRTANRRPINAGQR
jgi:putative transposase